ncbi:MAG: glycosyltransferase family A protein [Desulfobacterales bacterium]
MKVLVSLTTTFERSDLLKQTLPSLLNQDFTPDGIILNISKEPYLKDSGFTEIPRWIKNLPVTVNWVENTGSYRKLLPAIEGAGINDLVVTADDDVLYGKYWLKELVEQSLEHPEKIVCGRGRKMKKNIFCRWQNYRNWPVLKKKSSSLLIVATGCGGVLYRKKLLDLGFIFDKKYLEISPMSDDLWFKMASMRKNVTTLACPGIDKNNIYLKHRQGLDRENFKKIRTRNRLKKFGQRIALKLKNYLGVNQTANDDAWDKICNFSQFQKP